MSVLGLLRYKSKSKTVCTSALVHRSLIKDLPSPMGFDSAQESQPPAEATSVGHREGYVQLRGHSVYKGLLSQPALS
jgi:hypothetical protein